MTPKLVTLDCAGTMVGVPENWTMGGFAAECARSICLEVTDEDATVYQKLYLSRLPDFVAVNMARDENLQRAFWRRLAQDWFRECELPLDSLDALMLAADELGFGSSSILFELYEDVIPCLDELDALGIRIAVISNWDYSLHRVLRMFGIVERFAVVKASLEEGVEKPDPRLFQLALDQAGYSAEETIHVGDDPVDDIEGAAAAGIRSVRIDRSLIRSERPVICSLADLTEAFGWID